jgi:hypothetical protein
MKKLLFLLVSLTSFSTFAQWETVKGSGNATKETREVGLFTGVTVSGSMNVHLTYGKPGTITIEGDNNILPYIETTVTNGKLAIKTKNKTNIKSKSKLNVYVSLTTLTELSLSGSGNITGDGAFENAGTTTIAVSGSGNINLAFAAFKQTTLSISGSGNMVLNGKNTNNISASVSGSGNIDCRKLQCDDVTAHISGSGNIRVMANKSIEARVNGSGNIYYTGSATNINSKTSGSGKIIKA